MDEWTGRWMSGLVDGWMEWTGRWMDGLVDR